MGIYVVAIGMTNLMKVVHVELSYKRAEVAMLKVFGQDFLSEFGHFPDAEGILAASPPDYILELMILH